MTANCVGKAGLFEAVDADSHQIAKTMCDGCDFIDQCRHLRDTRDPKGGAPYLHGTWAGELWIEGKRVEFGVRKAERKPAVPTDTKPCETAGCDTQIPARRRYCDPCKVDVRAATQAKYDQARPAKVNRPTDRQKPCLRCGVRAGQPCIGPSGQPIGHSHAIRAGKRCQCGLALDGRADYCPDCRIETRREVWRERAQTKRATKPSDAEAHPTPVHTDPNGDDGLETASASEHNNEGQAA
jgi:hypothetical protein